MSNNSECKYSIVIPVYNERGNLKPLYENIVDAMLTISDSYEVILVDDGSTDGSREVIQSISQNDHRFKYIFFASNCGQTAAFDAGFKTAVGEYIITMDADLQVDAHDIPLLLAHIDRYDSVIGFRQKRSDNWLKLISSKIANFVRNKLSAEDIRDVGCPLKIIRRAALQNIKLFDGMHRFFPTLLKLEGYTVAEVPIPHYARRYGQSKYNIRNRVFKSLHDLFAVRWMKQRYLNYKIVKRG